MPGTAAVRSDVRAVDGGDRRRLIARPALPSARAVVGGLLLAVAAVVTFTTWQGAAATPDTSYAVASRALHPGERLGATDVRLVPVELASRLTGQAFTRPDDVVGRIALGPIGEDELIQQGQLSEAASAVPLVEVSFALPRDRALDGQLRSGDRIDVFATYDDRTEEVVRGAQVVGLGGGEGPSLAPTDQVTVTVALEDVGRRAELVHAVRAGEVTLVRSTHSAATAETADTDETAETTDAGEMAESSGAGATAESGQPPGGGADVFQPDVTAPGMPG